MKLTADTAAFPSGINYFGFWLSALDSGNQVAFYNKDVLVRSLSPSDMLAQISGNRAYFGNTNAAFAGQDHGEGFAFVNFYDTTGSFDEISFSQNGGGGYESDNHTIGYYTSVGGIPEPTTRAMLAAGFGLIGSSLRGHRPNTVAA